MIFPQLKESLSRRDWLEANHWTFVHFSSRPGAEFEGLDQLNGLWEEHSQGRFGPRIQAGLWHRLGGGLATGWDRWKRFSLFGEAIGWKRGGMWVALPGVFDPPSQEVPILAGVSDPPLLPIGCFPFHNVMAEPSWKAGFSPRDGWGEAVWDRWAQLFAAVLKNEGKDPQGPS